MVVYVLSRIYEWQFGSKYREVKQKEAVVVAYYEKRKDKNDKQIIIRTDGDVCIFKFGSSLVSVTLLYRLGFQSEVVSILELP